MRTSYLVYYEHLEHIGISIIGLTQVNSNPYQHLRLCKPFVGQIPTCNKRQTRASSADLRTSGPKSGATRGAGQDRSAGIRVALRESRDLGAGNHFWLIIVALQISATGGQVWCGVGRCGRWVSLHYAATSALQYRVQISIKMILPPGLGLYDRI